MDRVAFTVSGKPVAKGRPRIVRNGAFVRAITPEKTRSYEGIVATFALDAMKGRQPFDGACSLEIVAYFQIPKSWSKKLQYGAIAGSVHPTGRPDGDNLLKAIADACNSIVWKDDSQAVECRVIKRYSHSPRVEVSVVHLQAAERGVEIVPTEKAA